MWSCSRSAWCDDIGAENGDECAYVFGATQGTPNRLHNRVINGHHYLPRRNSATRTSSTRVWAV